MVDNLNNNIGAQRLQQLNANLQAKTGGSTETAKSADFQSILKNSIDEVNRLQQDAEKATTELATGKTDNVAEVFSAIKKADLAFQTLMQMRNELMDAYDEIKQMRV
ncbi:MAG: flagellar hook-basal body complex protein FliE [Phycisphaerae bacterium]|nr:flagellar hook-basal body complex protein FliE [Phycisphaerae bacterium]